jgi:carbamoyltransferase
MPQITLGLSGSIGHDPAAALFVDGELVAAAEEEKLIRRKHAKGEVPYHAARYCLQYASVSPADVDMVAIPIAPISLFSRARWHYAWRHWYAPDRAIDSLLNGNRRYRRYLKTVRTLLEQLHIPWQRIKFVPVQHQLAHASSVYHLSGYEGKTGILTIDSRGEYATILLAVGENGRITKIKEFYDPDSLSGMYAAMTDYLGFEILDGELKVMGMAPFGDPGRYDLSFLADYDGKHFKIDNRLISTVGFRRYKAKSRGHYFSSRLLEKLGPRREGALVDDPYVHYAAGIQKFYEDIAAALVTHYLYPVLKETGKLVFAGTGSMNVKLNHRLQELPSVKELFVHPGGGDSGSAIGAASYATASAGTTLKPLRTMSLGPRFTKNQCISACRNHRDKPQWEELENAPARAAELLHKGHLVGWFQGRMEFGPRALGNRSILANPLKEGITEQLNSAIKFRERWRPFSPSLLDSMAPEFLESGHDHRFMCISQEVNSEWREKFANVVYKDNSTRPHIVTHDANPRFYQLLRFMEERTGYGIVINTALNRPGEALVCSPEDAINLLVGSELEYLIMEDILVTKREEADTW